MHCECQNRSSKILERKNILKFEKINLFIYYFIYVKKENWWDQHLSLYKSSSASVPKNISININLRWNNQYILY